MTESNLPGRTEWESNEWRRDRGHRVAVIEAYRYLAIRTETDPSFPLPDNADALIASAAAAMQDISATRTADAEAYAARSLANIHAAVAEVHAEIYPRSAA